MFAPDHPHYNLKSLNRVAIQVEGANGLPMLAKKMKANGPGVLWYGAVATATATFVGHYPW